MCERNSPAKNDASTGCVRETLQINMKPEKLPWFKKKEKKKKKREQGMCKRNSHDQNFKKPLWDV